MLVGAGECPAVPNDGSRAAIHLPATQMANSGSYADEPFGTFAPTALARSIIAVTRRLPETWLGRRATLALRAPGGVVNRVFNDSA